MHETIKDAIDWLRKEMAAGFSQIHQEINANRNEMIE